MNLTRIWPLGSQWSPKSMSGNLLLINGLLFALVIYNSFAAFITSVLSVQNISIKDLKDLADSDLAFGYTLGNADELFLRVTMQQGILGQQIHAPMGQQFFYYRRSTTLFCESFISKG